MLQPKVSDILRQGASVANEGGIDCALLIVMSWRKCPFIKGQKYRIKNHFSKFSQNFAEGEIVEFLEDGYSRYDNLTIYAFRETRTEESLSLEIADTEQIEDWSRYFEIQ